MDLAPDFNEFIGSLLAHRVEFVIVGAYALAVHGAPRATGDLDVFVRPTKDNAASLLAAVRDFGFPISELSVEQILEPTRILEMGIEPVQIHIMSTISGVSWDEVWSKRLTVRCGDFDTPFIGRDAFLKNKKSAGRPKDLADLDALGSSC
jgi:hypothetical protein